MFAIVETGGKQYQVEEGRYLDVELLDGEKDSKVVFDKVVMIVNGKKSKVGQPYVAGASAEGTIVKLWIICGNYEKCRESKRLQKKTRTQTRLHKSNDF